MPYGPRTYRGDPGILGTIARGVGGLVGGVLGRTPVGMAYGAARGLISSQRRPSASTFAAPGGATMGGRGQQRKPGSLEAKMKGIKKRRRMNVANPKALRRAIRREQGFVKLAKKALRGTGYRVVSAGSQRKRVQVRESGAGSVTVH